MNVLFIRYDVREIFYFLRIGSIDLYLCDDLEDRGVDGGVMYFKMNKLFVDYFSYYLVGIFRNDWLFYNEVFLIRVYWVNDFLSVFRNF